MTYHEAIEAELKKMCESGIIRPAKYPKWIANMVMVPNSFVTEYVSIIVWKIRICIDFSDLNKVFPKNNFPFTDIPQMVKSQQAMKHSR